MRIGARLLRSLRRVRHEDSGFTLIELISAVLVTTLGVVALITTLDSSRELITFAETKETAVHIGERELEQIQALEYDDIALEDDPVPCNAVPDPVCDLNNPAFYVTNSLWYRWDQVPRGQQCDAAGNPRGSCEQLVIDKDTDGAGPDGSGDVRNIRETFTENAPTGGVRLTVELQRFISWVDDDCVKPAPLPGTCTGNPDYKRITVAVRILKLTQGTREQLPNSGPGRPILLSTVVRPPS